MQNVICFGIAELANEWTSSIILAFQIKLKTAVFLRNSRFW